MDTPLEVPSARFVAIDVETAAATRASICQIALAHFEAQAPPIVWSSYVHPECDFRPINVHVHGIRAEHVQAAPTFPSLYDRLVAALDGQVVAQYSAFDSQAIEQTLERYQMRPLNCTWVDVCAVAQLVWPHLWERGFALDQVAAYLGLGLVHHEAEEDARVAGEVLRVALAETGIPLQELPRRIRRGNVKAVPPREYPPCPCATGGPLAGQVVVFTGDLAIPRGRAEMLALRAGATIATGVTKRTTIVVYGEVDPDVSPGGKSGKLCRAEALLAAGRPIRIVDSAQFMALVDGSASCP